MLALRFRHLCLSEFQKTNTLKTSFISLYRRSGGRLRNRRSSIIISKKGASPTPAPSKLNLLTNLFRFNFIKPISDSVLQGPYFLPIFIRYAFSFYSFRLPV